MLPTVPFPSAVSELAIGLVVALRPYYLRIDVDVPLFFRLIRFATIVSSAVTAAARAPDRKWHWRNSFSAVHRVLPGDSCRTRRIGSQPGGFRRLLEVHPLFICADADSFWHSNWARGDGFNLRWLRVEFWKLFETRVQIRLAKRRGCEETVWLNWS